MWQTLKRADRGRLGLIGIGLAIVLFVALNLLSGFVLTSSRLDLTEDRLFTLSEGTREVLQGIEERVDLRFYYSEQLDELGPYFASHARRVEELLEQYQRLADGKVRIERLDPESYSPEEDLAVRDLPVSEDGALAYFGLSGRNSTDDSQVIGYRAPERANFLEYDLTQDDLRPVRPGQAGGRGGGRPAAHEEPVRPIPALAGGSNRCTSSSTCASSAAASK